MSINPGKSLAGMTAEIREPASLVGDRPTDIAAVRRSSRRSIPPTTASIRFLSSDFTTNADILVERPFACVLVSCPSRSWHKSRSAAPAWQGVTTEDTGSI